MGRTVQAGTFYRHFKDKLYQILTIASHSETGEPMVVYQALYGDYKVYVRPLEMFLSEVDHDKYPDCRQRYRFEQVEPAAGPDGFDTGSSQGNTGEGSQGNNAGNDHGNTHLLRFLEAETTAEKLEVLETIKGHIDAAQIESICLTLDIPYESGDVIQQIEGIRKVLKMRQHYDGGRLRS